MSGVVVDRSAAMVVATDAGNDVIEVKVRNGEQLYFRVLSPGAGETSITVVLDASQTRQLLEGVIELLQLQRPDV